MARRVWGEQIFGEEPQVEEKVVVEVRVRAMSLLGADKQRINKLKGRLGLKRTTVSLMSGLARLA